MQFIVHYCAPTLYILERSEPRLLNVGVENFFSCPVFSETLYEELDRGLFVRSFFLEDLILVQDERWRRG